MADGLGRMLVWEMMMVAVALVVGVCPCPCPCPCVCGFFLLWTRRHMGSEDVGCVIKAWRFIVVLLFLYHHLFKKPFFFFQKRVRWTNMFVNSKSCSHIAWRSSFSVKFEQTCTTAPRNLLLSLCIPLSLLKSSYRNCSDEVDGV